MKRALVLGFALSLAARMALAQDANLLKRGAEAYDVAEYGRAKPLLVEGLNPALSTHDSLWIESVYRLAHILIEENHDSLAAVWLRWAIRTYPAIPPDTLNFPPAVQDAFAAAQNAVLKGKVGDTLPFINWEWMAGAADSLAGYVRLARGTQASAFIDGIGVITTGEMRRAAPGSYRLTLGAPGRAPVTVTREVLPGITTVIPARSAAAGAVPADVGCSARNPGGNRADKTLQLGLEHWYRGVLDSAVVDFAAAISADPFVALDSGCAGLPVASAFGAARRSTQSVALRGSSDTTLDVTRGHWPLALAVGRPGAVAVRLSRVDSSHAEWPIATSQVDSTAVLSVSLTDPDRRRLPFGTYRVRATYSSGDAKGEAGLTFEILAPDTLAREAPPAASAYKPETQAGPRPTSSILKGVALGAAVAAIPMVLGHSGFESSEREERAMVVGFTAAVGGLAGFMLGRHQVPAPENVAYNQALRTAWEDRDRAISATNAARRDGSLVRIRVVAQ